MFRVTHKEEIFFDYFVETAKSACKAAEMLQDLMVNYVNVHEKIKNIEEAEHDGDQHVHKILRQLNKSFITPIDREDIYLIAKELDNITDDIEATAHRFNIFNVKSIRKDALDMIELIVQCANELVIVISEMKNMKNSKILRDKIIEVNRIEDEGDKLFRKAMANLFISEIDAVEVIKWKEIYDFLENTLDACEDVANAVEGVVMKHA